MPTNIRDPRTLVTPDAFEIHDGLLGFPLATPWRRLGAMAIDLVVIGVLTVFTGSIQLFVWGAVALFIIRIAFQRPGRASQAVAVLLRVFAGCLGLTLLSAVVIAFLFLRGGDDEGDGDDEGFDPGPVAAALVEPDEEPAEGPGDAASSEDAGDTAAAGGEDAGTAGSADDVEDMTPAEVLAAYAAVLAADEAVPGPAAAREEALRRRAAVLLAADTLERLEERVEDLGDERDDAREELREARRALEEESGSFAALLRDIWNQAGSAIGLWSIYFTVLLTLWKGQTVGKRALGIRVLRLDGEPLTWWTSFERGGGYVAGLATGLLGFAQVFWDANRQCIHDKIVGTVVVVDGAPRVEGAWLEARSTKETRKTAGDR